MTRREKMTFQLLHFVINTVLKYINGKASEIITLTILIQSLVTRNDPIDIFSFINYANCITYTIKYCMTYITCHQIQNVECNKTFSNENNIFIKKRKKTLYSI